MPLEDRATAAERRFFTENPDAEYDFLPTSVFDSKPERLRAMLAAPQPPREQAGQHDDADQT